jgi:hypothetical protein
MEKPVRRRAFLFNLFIMLMVPKAGLEPARLSPLPPQGKNCRFRLSLPLLRATLKAKR